MCFMPTTMRRFSPYPSPGTPNYMPGRRVLTIGNAVRLGNYLGRAARNVFNTRSTPSRARSSGSGTAPAIYGGGATKPYKRQYGRRRRTRRVRRRARIYYKKFQKALRKVSGVAFQKAILNGSKTGSPGVGQSYLATHLFSYNSNAVPVLETGVRDTLQLRSSMTNTFYTDDVNDTTKFMIEYGILDCTLFNNGNARLEVDFYHITYRDNVEYGTFATFMSGSDVRQQSLTSTAADKIDITDRGATLFDLPQMLSNGYVTIVSKEKLFMGVGDTYNFQYKVKKPASITKSEIDADNVYFARRSHTHTWVAVFKRVIGDTGDSPSLSLGSTRTYGWRVDGQTQPGTAVLAE